MTCTKRVRTVFLLAGLLLGCQGKKASDMPMPHDPSTNEPGVDTVPAQPPAPGSVTGNAAPIGNDESVNAHDPALEQGAGARAGKATPGSP